MKHARMSWMAAALLAVACDRKDPPADAKSADAAAKTATPSASATAADPKAAAPEPAADLPAAADLLEKAAAAQGGKQRLAALESFQFEGQLTVAGQNIKGDMRLWWKKGDFYTEQTMIGIGTVRAGKQGDVTWAEDPINGLRKLEGLEAEQHMWASSPSLAAEWERYFASAQTVGKRDLAGKPAYDVELTSTSGAKVKLTFDAASGLQVGNAFSQSTPMGPMPVSVELQDYRDVGGLKLPFVQVTDASLATATMTLTKVELDVPVDVSKFAMPTGGAAAATK